MFLPYHICHNTCEHYILCANILLPLYVVVIFGVGNCIQLPISLCGEYLRVMVLGAQGSFARLPRPLCEVRVRFNSLERAKPLYARLKDLAYTMLHKMFV